MRMQAFRQEFNKRVIQGEMFFFLIDFEQEKPVIFSPKEAYNQEIFFNFKGLQNYPFHPQKIKLPELQAKPVSKEVFSRAYKQVQQHLHKGDTYLLNLTFSTPIQIEQSLHDIFEASSAPYKIYYKNRFVCFSPETFVKIQGNRISTYPMKGTIDALIPDAEKKLLDNKKEFYEHNTIVDLLRNDLSIVAGDIQVEKFRYIDRIEAGGKSLLQASSEITGKLMPDWRKDAWTIFEKMLPAGSISGAPKQKTLEIIRKVESEKRGYYTGIAGFFDGENFDTAVLIRFLEKRENAIFYRSGGGVTALSNLDDEYNELIQKIYVPTN